MVLWHHTSTCLTVRSHLSHSRGGTGPVDGPNACPEPLPFWTVHATVSTHMLSKPKNACGNNSPSIHVGFLGCRQSLAVGGEGGGVARSGRVAGTTNLKYASAICQYTTLLYTLIRELVRSFFISWDRGLKDIV